MAKKNTRNRKWESEIVPSVGFVEPTYSFIHCEKVDKSRMFGKDVFAGTNCALENIGKPIKCKIGDLDKICVETIHLYDEYPPTYPKNKRHK